MQLRMRPYIECRSLPTVLYYFSRAHGTVEYICYRCLVTVCLYSTSRITNYQALMHFLLCAIDKRSDTGIDYRGISVVIVTIMTN